jgi:hypothetical protein
MNISWETTISTHLLRCPSAVTAFATVLLLSLAAPAQAGTICVENFDYAAGILSGQGSWISHPAGCFEVQAATLEPYTSGDIYIPHKGSEAIANSDGSSILNLNSSLGKDGDTLYVSFLAETKFNNEIAAVAGVSLCNLSSGDFLFIGQPWQIGFWGINSKSGKTSNQVVSAAPSNRISFVVARLTFQTGLINADLYINPKSQSLPSRPDTTLMSIASPQGYNSLRLESHNSILTVSAIRIGTSYEDVIPYGSN